MFNNKGLNVYITIIGAFVGVASLTLAYLNYKENKELRKIQKELAQIDLDTKKKQQGKINNG
jgi:lipid II:glycine glycyltransferase (peptidoglycan interpeptide bridge formation enzyme)